jgi:hypothetical protein
VIEGRIKAASPYISQVLVYGDRRNYCTALVTLDPDSIARWATTRGLPTQPATLVSMRETRQLIQEALDRVNAALARYETIKCFALLDAEFSVERGELTPSLKIKRRVVERRYAAVLDACTPKPSTASDLAPRARATRVRRSACGQRARVLWLVEAELASSGQLDSGQQAPAFVGDRTGELHAFALQRIDGCVDVLTHQVQLVPRRALGWMDGHLRGWERKDQPSAAGVDGRESQHITEKRTDPVGVLAVQNRMDSADHSSLALHDPCSLIRLIVEISRRWSTRMPAAAISPPVKNAPTVTAN